jgi:hypothetical protein
LLRHGQPLAWYDVRSHHLVTFASSLEPQQCAVMVEALSSLVKDGRAKNIEVRKINGLAIDDTSIDMVNVIAVLEQHRFVRGYRGLVLRD